MVNMWSYTVFCKIVYLNLKYFYILCSKSFLHGWVQLSEGRILPSAISWLSFSPVLFTYHSHCCYIMGLVLVGCQCHSGSDHPRCNNFADNIFKRSRNSKQLATSILREGYGCLDGCMHNFRLCSFIRVYSCELYVEKASRNFISGIHTKYNYSKIF